MYWPVGAPKVYALSKHQAPSIKITHSHDGLDSDDQSCEGPSGSITNSDTRSSNDLEHSSSISEQDENSSQHDRSDSGRKDILALENDIIAAKVSRGGSIFATITRSSLTIWQTKPSVALVTVIRSSQSMRSYGPSTALLLRPDAMIIVIQTTLGYLITYSVAIDPNARVYQPQLATSHRHTRKDSGDGYNSYRRAGTVVADAPAGEGDGIKEVNVRFRMAIRIDAGISVALAQEDELVVATKKPAALQCIRWNADKTQSQTSTELMSKMPWLATRCSVVEMIYDRPMNLMCWLMSDGRAYAVQRRSAGDIDMDHPSSMFQGFCFREKSSEGTAAINAAINARFSLIAIGCDNGDIDVYVVKDYMGNIPISHQLRLTVPQTNSGRLTFLSYSPDGYCLFAGFERGWASWSVYGKAGVNSFSNDKSLSLAFGEVWLCGVRDGFWLGGGCELALIGMADDRIWSLDMARSSLSGCYSPANVARGLLHSSGQIMVYRGHDIPDFTLLPSELSLWQTIQVPQSYLLHQWPIKVSVSSPDGNYIAVAGRRGLAHYSTTSGRWRTFEDAVDEHELAVRGGMCWYQHFLIACVESESRYQVRVYSREKALNYSNIQHIEDLAAPAIFMTVSGADSLLVYTYDNTLLHFIIVPTRTSIKLVQVGQIGFHGIIRAPPRVRAISWIVPEDQLEHGDPSQDVATASVLFLVDGKLVLLQPSTNEFGELKYDMRVIAQNVEYYILLRDQPNSLIAATNAANSPPTSNGLPSDDHLGHSLRDSLWYFDGSAFHVWPDVQDVMASAPTELGRDLPTPVQIPVDFYPLSAMVGKGIVNGLDADLVQRRDVNFAFFRHSARTQLFLPQLLRYHLSEYNSPAALHLSHSYQHLPYFPHALEILLHDVLDAEVDNPPSPPETALLPTVISFLSSFPSYLDVIVNCTRKTELRSWRTLFSYLPPVLELFEQSLSQGKLKTAAGYLLVLHTLQQEVFQIHESARLLQRAVTEQDWALCKELARFLLGIDSSGQALQAAMTEAGLEGDRVGSLDGVLVNGSHGRSPPIPQVSSGETNGHHRQNDLDYFSIARQADEGREEKFSTPDA